MLQAEPDYFPHIIVLRMLAAARLTCLCLARMLSIIRNQVQLMLQTEPIATHHCAAHAGGGALGCSIAALQLLPELEPHVRVQQLAQVACDRDTDVVENPGCLQEDQNL